MGIGPNLSCSGGSGGKSVVTNFKYTILDSWCARGYMALWVKYPEFTNYNGEKILVLSGSQPPKEFDPHFYENSPLIARFIPTKDGWTFAIDFIQSQLLFIRSLE